MDIERDVIYEKKISFKYKSLLYDIEMLIPNR